MVSFGNNYNNLTIVITLDNAETTATFDQMSVLMFAALRHPSLVPPLSQRILDLAIQLNAKQEH